MMPWESCVLWYGYPLQNGIWPDVSMHDNDGIITGAVWQGDSLEFDGIDDLVNSGNHTSLDITEEITIEALVKPYSLGEGNYGYEVYKLGTFILYMLATQRTRFYITDSLGNAHTTTAANNSVVLNEWSHILGTYNGTIQKIYVNGTMQPSTNSWSGTIKSQPTHSMYIGNKSDGTRTFDGKIAFVRVYNKGFSAHQAREAYEHSYRLM